MRPTPPLILTKAQQSILEAIVRSRQLPHSLVQRALIVLNAGGKNNKESAAALGIKEDTVGLWRKRWLGAVNTLNGCAEDGKAL